MLFADRKSLRRTDKIRTTKLTSQQAQSLITPDKDGFVKGRAADGTPIKGKIGGGESVTRRLIREKAERDAKEGKESSRTKRSRKREERRKRRASKSEDLVAEDGSGST